MCELFREADADASGALSAEVRTLACWCERAACTQRLPAVLQELGALLRRYYHSEGIGRSLRKVQGEVRTGAERCCRDASSCLCTGAWCGCVWSTDVVPLQRWRCTTATAPAAWRSPSAPLC